MEEKLRNRGRKNLINDLKDSRGSRIAVGQNGEIDVTVNVSEVYITLIR